MLLTLHLGLQGRARADGLLGRVLERADGSVRHRQLLAYRLQLRGELYVRVLELRHLREHLRLVLLELLGLTLCQLELAPERGLDDRRVGRRRDELLFLFGERLVGCLVERELGGDRLELRLVGCARGGALLDGRALGFGLLEQECSCLGLECRLGEAHLLERSLQAEELRAQPLLLSLRLVDRALAVSVHLAELEAVHVLLLARLVGVPAEPIHRRGDGKCRWRHRLVRGLSLRARDVLLDRRVKQVGEGAQSEWARSRVVVPLALHAIGLIGSLGGLRGRRVDGARGRRRERRPAFRRQLRAQIGELEVRLVQLLAQRVDLGLGHLELVHLAGLGLRLFDLELRQLVLERRARLLQHDHLLYRPLLLRAQLLLLLDDGGDGGGLDSKRSLPLVGNRLGLLLRHRELVHQQRQVDPLHHASGVERVLGLGAELRLSLSQAARELLLVLASGLGLGCLRREPLRLQLTVRVGVHRGKLDAHVLQPVVQGDPLCCRLLCLLCRFHRLGPELIPLRGGVLQR
mmetsp:Transcript_36562/g.77996  ORF Transcript_36562/g.77996 Transcript_36562/m.77996 type:complete len:520 (-) Transcript_36562:988-2547(-)